MKKIKSLLAVILVLSIGFSLLACGKKGQSANGKRCC